MPLKSHAKEELKPAMIQKFYNDALNGKQDNKKAISPKTVKNLHGIVHKALQQAVEIGYIKLNPAAVCVLPKVQKAKINPMDEQQTKLFIKAISNTGCLLKSENAVPKAERVWVEEQAMIGSEIIGRFRRLIWERLQRPDTVRY